MAKLEKDRDKLISLLAANGSSEDDIIAMARSYADDLQQAASQHFANRRRIYEENGYNFDEYDHSQDIDVDKIIDGLTNSGNYDLTDPDQARQFAADAGHTSSRHRMRKCIKGDPSRPLWARIPSGISTCAFCAMLASRGFVYSSEEKAGGQGNTYHAHCSCRIEPSWDRDDHPDDYHPEVYKALYDRARAELGPNPSQADILASMRQHGKDILKDAQPTKSSFSTDWPTSKKLLSMKGQKKGTEAEWRRRQEAVGVPITVDQLERHEIVFLEKFKAAGHDYEWIPRATTADGIGTSTNDFLWKDHPGGPVKAELKSLGSTDYSKATGRIAPAVTSAAKHDVVKDTFILDYGDTALPDKVVNQLSRYNINHQKNPEAQIKELWVWCSEGLKQIPLK